MKILKCLCLLFFSLSAFNTNAAVTVERVWRPSTQDFGPGERIPFAEFKVSSNTAESIDYLEVQTAGLTPAQFVLQNIAIRNRSQKVAGKATPATDSEAAITRVYLERTVVLPGYPEYLRIEGETSQKFRTNDIQKPVAFLLKAISTSNGRLELGFIEGASTTHYVGTSKRQTGNLDFVSRYGFPTFVEVGRVCFMGAFMVGTDNIEEMNIFPNIGVHAFGGRSTDFSSVYATIVQLNGQIYHRWLYREEESGIPGDYYFERENPLRLGDAAIIAIFGTPGTSFSGGGSFAISTTLEKWRGTGIMSGREPVFSAKTLAGPTMSVLPTHYGGMGATIPQGGGDLK